MPAATVANNAYGVLASAITSGVTSLTLQTGNGARFPTITGTNYFWGTLIDASNNIEIVKCTAHAAASDTFTITRAQQSTTAKAYSAGDRFEMRITKSHLDEKLSLAGGTMTGVLYNNYGLSTSVDPTGSPNYVVNLDYFDRHNSIKIDVNYPIEMAVYGMVFRATNGKTYILYTTGNGAATESPFFGASSTAATTQTHCIAIPEYVDGVGPLSYVDYVFATDAAECFIIAWTQDGRAVGTGLAGAGHFGLGNATDVTKWTLIWDGQDISKSYFTHWPKKILTNNRYLHNADTNTTVWILTDLGTIYAAGEGATGALGNNATTDSTVWYNSMQTGLTAIDNVRDMWCAPNTTSPVAICQKYDGTWWAVGAGASGVCGGGVVTNRLVWTQIPELPTTTAQKVLLAGTGVIVDCHILFTDGTVWSAGDNNNGSLGDGTVVLKNTYAQRATNIANIWLSSTHLSTGNLAAWYLGNDGVLYTSGDSATYATLSGLTTDKTAFTAATDIPASSTLDAAWPGGAESQAFFFQRWFDTSTLTYKIYAVGYATDGNRGHNALAAATLNSNITNLLPVSATDIFFMDCKHIANANRKGASILVTNSGDLYAAGRVVHSTDGGTTWNINAPYPHRDSPTASPMFVRVKLEDYSA